MAAVACCGVLLTACSARGYQVETIILVVAVASTRLGSVSALGQTDFQRLLSYSFIGHVGCALRGRAAGTQAGIQGMLVYLAYYLVTNLGMFACIAAMRRDGERVVDMRQLAGLSRTQPDLALAFPAITLSLPELPAADGIFARATQATADMQAQAVSP